MHNIKFLTVINDAFLYKGNLGVMLQLPVNQKYAKGENMYEVEI